MAYVGAIDQGTTSTRFLVFDHAGRVVASAQEEHRQFLPRAGWVEHDPLEIVERTNSVIATALAEAGLLGGDVVAVGIANQRETTVLWDRATGEPVHPAIVWQDTRTDRLCRELAGSAGPDRWRDVTGLPIATYFSGPKARWMLDEVPRWRERAERGEIAFGTIDTWLLWNLTGGPRGGVHATDVTNASRTLLFDLRSLDWSDDVLGEMHVPRAMLPEVRSSVGGFGTIADGPLAGVPITGMLGDQQAALFGQTCFDPGDAKNTYGTGCFMLLNTGTEPVASNAGLLTTVAYRIGNESAVYALEGSIAIAGALVQWLRDELELIADAGEMEPLARSVEDNGGACIVPAFSGLYAPRWRSDARGVIAGLTRYVTRAHLARAALEATAWQTREVLDAMQADSGVPLNQLRVDGGMVVNELLLEIQADVLGVPVMRPAFVETTALGAAYAAGLGSGFWSDVDELRSQWTADGEWRPRTSDEDRARARRTWNKAVDRSLDWVDDE